MIKNKYKNVSDDLMENNILNENEYKRICAIFIKKGKIKMILNYKDNQLNFMVKLI